MGHWSFFGHWSLVIGHCSSVTAHWPTPSNPINLVTISTPSPSPPSSKVKTFFRRLLSFIILWTVVLGAMFSGNKLISNSVFLVIMVLFVAFGLEEFYELMAKRGLVCFKWWGIIGGILLI